MAAKRFSREALETYVGKFDGKYDLRGILLSGVDLSSIDLSEVGFFAADLSNANFSRCDFSGSYLSECNISKSLFDWATLDGALLDNVQFNSGARFLGVDLHKVNFTFATLL